MDIWVTWCKRKIICPTCNEEIAVASPIVKSPFKSWHPECWLKEALAYLELHPYKTRHKGRPKLKLSAEEKRQRLRLQVLKSYYKRKGTNHNRLAEIQRELEVQIGKKVDSEGDKEEGCI